MNDKKLFTKENYYINTIGDYVIEVWISKKTADMVEQVYKTTDKLTNEVVIELKNILEMKGKTKIVISKNSKKAERLRKMMKKNFYIPKI